MTVKAKTAGLGIIEFANTFNNISPDLVVVRGDRFEVLSAVTAASYMNIPIAHIEGGDRSGTLDEAVRHSITKLSHIHFPTNEESKKRILRMGENKKYVFNFGSPDIEMVHDASLNGKNNIDISFTGSGANIDINDKFLVVMYHPVSTDTDMLSARTKELLNIVHEINIPTLWFWPNADFGAEEIAQEMRSFNDIVSEHKIRFMRYLPPRQFIYILKNANCLIGNSSAGIKECSYIGTPVVNLGTRQEHRMRERNVIDVAEDSKEIKRAIDKQLRKEKYKPSNLYYVKNTSKNIANKLATLNLYVQKQFHD